MYIQYEPERSDSTNWSTSSLLPEKRGDGQVFFFEEEGEEEEKKKEENQTLFISFLDPPLVTGAHEDGHNNHKTSVGCV